MPGRARYAADVRAGLSGGLAVALAAVLVACLAPSAAPGPPAWWVTGARPAGAGWTPWPGGALPDGWRREPTVAPEEGGRLCHAAGGAPDYPVRERLPAEFDAGVQARVEPGGEEAYGLLLRAPGSERSYLARANTRNNNVRLYRRDGARWALLGGRDLAVPVGTWRELILSVRGGHLVVGLDGEPLLEVAGASWDDAGLALWAGPQTTVCFEQLWVWPAR